MKRVGKKLGDTLIEVTIAIGIFSLVAIAVVSVVNGSTSSAQSALETTVARAEMDAQAEALRFIHNSFLASTDSGTSKYETVWNKIIKLAKTPEKERDIQYIPSTCNEIYNGNGDESISKKNAFVINTHNLQNAKADDIIITYNKSSGSFKEAATYPRLVFNKNDSNNTLLGQDVGNNLQWAEGIYIQPIKDTGNTYYDFYIRTCWYGPGANVPTTISTVIRLYNPDVMDKDTKPATSDNYGYNLIFYKNDGSNEKKNIFVRAGGQHEFGTIFTRDTYEFWAWCEGTATNSEKYNADPTCSGKIYKSGEKLNADAYMTTKENRTFYAMWKKRKEVKVWFYRVAGEDTKASQTFYINDPARPLKTIKDDLQWTVANYSFSGWCKGKLTACPKDTGTVTYSDGQSVQFTDANVTSINLYGIWKENPHTTITFSCGEGELNSGQGKQKIYKGDNNAKIYDISTVCTAPAGYEFNGWKGSDNKTYVNGASFSHTSNSNSSLTLTAQWERTLDDDYVAAKGTTKGNCTEGIEMDKNFVTGTINAHSGLAANVNNGNYDSGEQKFTINLNGYKSAIVVIEAATNFSGDTHSAWQKFDDYSWSIRHYWEDWGNNKGEWKNDGSTASGTYTFETSGEHTLRAGGHMANGNPDGDWSYSCIVVKSITLKL